MCNEFAGTFLVPEESLDIHNASAVNIADVERWAKEYSVSPEVILTRIRKEKIISQKNYNNLLNTIQTRYKALQKKGKAGGVDPYIVKESYLGKKYISLVYSKYYKNQISVEQLADFLDVKPDFALSLEPKSRIKNRKKGLA